MILVTGCNGLLGSFISRTLVEKGYAVKGYIREHADLRLIPLDIQSKMSWAKGTLFDTFALALALEGIDTIIHTAAVVSFSPARINEMYHVNVQGTANLVNEALAKNAAIEFIHISSIAALGRPIGKELINEEELWVESDHNSHYAISKYLTELEVYRGFEEGLNGFVANPSVILSPGDLKKSSCRLFGYVANGGSYYSKGSFNYIDVRDVCALLIKLMESNTPVGEKYILNAGQIDYKHFFETVALEMGLTPPSKEAGAFLKEILWRLEYVRSLVSGSEPLISKETARLTGVSHVFDNQKINQLFDYQFHSMDETVKWVCRELKQPSAVYNLLQKDR